jgi:hypothetical protein
VRHPRRGHQWRRRWVKGFDPKTPKQVYWRARLAAASQAYNEALTDEQQDACIAARACPERAEAETLNRVPS